MLTLIRDLRALIALANEIGGQDTGGKPRWSLFATNRSFIAVAIAVALNALAVSGLPVPAVLAGIVPELLAGQVVETVTVAMAVWAGVERLLGTTRVIWSRRQALKAVEEAAATAEVPRDVLAFALRRAGVSGVVDRQD